MENLKALCYQLRKDTVDIIMSGATGHIGGDMSVMEILADLYFKQMNVSPDKADDFSAKDRSFNRADDFSTGRTICHHYIQEKKEWTQL